MLGDVSIFTLLQCSHEVAVGNNAYRTVCANSLRL